jgi:hypothetical protein
MAFDEAVGKIVLFGGVDWLRRPLGDTWLFDGAAWSEVAGRGPTARRYSAMAYSPDLGGCILHGGSVDDMASLSLGDTWIFRGGKWARIQGLNSPPRDDHGLAYHLGTCRLVTSGGLSAGSTVCILTTAGWEPAEVDPTHLPYQCSPLVWDEQVSGLVMHGGETGQGGAQSAVTRVLCVAN